MKKERVMVKRVPGCCHHPTVGYQLFYAWQRTTTAAVEVISSAVKKRCGAMS
jgi:hypothetical protein